jgi:hypothetical protein
MKNLAVNKLDTSSLISNLLVVCAIVAASAPVILGDQLVVIASEVVRQSTVGIESLSISLQRILS